jgi:hypothetical protein
MAERRTTNAERRLRRLTEEEPETEPRGILELFPEGEPADEDAALTRDAGSVAGKAADARQEPGSDDAEQ